MNRANSTRTVAISGLVIMALTVALFFLLTDADLRSDVDWWGFAFMLFAELAATAGIIGLHNANQGYRPLLMAGGVSVLMFYAVSSVAVALLFLNLFRDSFKRMIALELVFIAVAVIVILVLWSNAKRLLASNNAVMYSVTAMGGLIARAEALYKNNGTSPYAKSLERLYEGLRYTDNTVMTQADQQIHQQLYDLETLLSGAPETVEVEGQIDLLLATVQQRGVQASQAKRGAI